jgi:hypothetical protein
MLLTSIILAQLTTTIPQCPGTNFYSTNCQLLAAPGIVTSNAMAEPPHCLEGYVLMADTMMHPKCVKGEIRDPE